MKMKLGLGGSAKPENKTGPNTMNERRDIFQTLYDQRYGV